MKKKKVAPKVIKGMSFDEMIEKGRNKQIKAEEYVKKTGLCCACRENPVDKGQLRCQSCIDKTEELLKQLRGPGFMELRI